MRRPRRLRKLFLFLNSAFGIWLLSSSVIGGLSVYYAHFQQCVHDADQMREDYYKLVYELTGRRKILALRINQVKEMKDLQDILRNFQSPIDTLGARDAEFKGTPYVEVYWKLRQVFRNTDFTNASNPLEAVKKYQNDDYWRLFSGEIEIEGLQDPQWQKLVTISRTLASQDAKDISLAARLKRHCGPMQVARLVFGTTSQILYTDSEVDDKKAPVSPAK